MEFKTLFEIPKEASFIEHLIVSDYEKKILLAMGKEQIHYDDLVTIVIAALKKVNLSVKASSVIGKMYSRGNINKVDDSTYECSTLYTRLAYFAQYEQDLWQRVPEKIRTDIDTWYVNKYADGARPRLEKVKSGELELIENAYFFTLKESLQLIDDIDKDIYVVPCNCRSVKMGCDKPKNVCMLFEYGINSEFDRGYGKIISKSEAKELVKLADKNGLMHTSEEAHALCNCCGDCCYPIRAAEVIGATGIWPKRRYDIVYEETSCITCKKCVKACNFGAFKYIDGKITFNNDKCLGCTICEGHCPTDAIQLKKL